MSENDDDDRKYPRAVLLVIITIVLALACAGFLFFTKFTARSRSVHDLSGLDSCRVVAVLSKSMPTPGGHGWCDDR